MQTSKFSWVTRRVAQLPNAAKKSKSVQGRSNAANPFVTLIFRRNDVTLRRLASMRGGKLIPICPGQQRLQAPAQESKKIVLRPSNE
jgi:hypothetical protein